MEKYEEAGSGEQQLVVFTLANETYGTDINTVNEIIRMQGITDVPKTPDFVEGVINLRGRIVPVIDLRKRFGLEVSGETQDSRVIVVEWEDTIVGMIVDSVMEVMRLSEGDIEPTPPMASDIEADYLRGVGKRNGELIILLDINKVLFKDQKKAVAQAAKQAAPTSQENGGAEQ